MSKEEFERYVDLIASMSIDFKMGNLSEATYLANLKTIVRMLGQK